MAISDEIRQEQNKLKGRTLKEKLSYFWDYYKIHTICVVVGIFLIFTVVRDIRSSKPYAFYGSYFNALQTFDGEAQMEEFSAFAGIDTEAYQATLDTAMYYTLTDMSETTLATSQRFAAMVSAQEIDMIIADEDVFSNYAVNEIFADLRDIMSSEELTKYEGNIFYIDRAEITAAEEADAYWGYDDDSEYYADLEETFHDHHDPSVMEEPIPVGIYVSDTTLIKESQCYPSSVPVFGIPANTLRLEAALQYLEFLGWE